MPPLNGWLVFDPEQNSILHRYFNLRTQSYGDLVSATVFSEHQVAEAYAKMFGGFVSRNHTDGPTHYVETSNPRR